MVLNQWGFQQSNEMTHHDAMKNDFKIYGTLSNINIISIGHAFKFTLHPHHVTSLSNMAPSF